MKSLAAFLHEKLENGMFFIGLIQDKDKSGITQIILMKVDGIQQVKENLLVTCLKAKISMAEL